VLGAAYLAAITNRGLRKGYTPGRDRAGTPKASSSKAAAASAAATHVEQQQVRAIEK
jgi:hypothetical protein